MGKPIYFDAIVGVIEEYPRDKRVKVLSRKVAMKRVKHTTNRVKVTLLTDKDWDHILDQRS
jgi:hypothetical protein